MSRDRKQRKSARRQPAARKLRSRNPLNRLLHLELLEDRRLLVTFSVSNLLDGPVTASGDLPGSLRQAIFDANVSPGADNVDFSASLSGATIALDGSEIEIIETLNIDAGPLFDNVVIDALQQSRIFNITATEGDFAFRRLTLTGGKTFGDNLDASDSTHSGGAIRSLTPGIVSMHGAVVTGNITVGEYACGGGLYVFGDVQLTDSVVVENQTTGDHAIGGAMATTGIITITDSQIQGNHTEGIGSFGGAFAALGIGDVSIVRATISNNFTEGDGSAGGAVYGLYRSVSIRESDMRRNQTVGSNAHGGAIMVNRGVVTLNNSTVRGNLTEGSNARGGAVLAGSIAINQSVVENNQTIGYLSSGGGIYSFGAIRVIGSTINGNSTAGDKASGGGIHAASDVTVVQSTVSGNATTGIDSSGAGINAGGRLHVLQSTVTNNSAAGVLAIGGGIRSFGRSTALTGTTIAGNQAGGGSDDLAAGSDELRIHHSLVGDNGGTGLAEAPIGQPDPNGNLIGGPVSGVIDPLLGSLGDNGGVIFADGSTIPTHALMPGSPAINAGDPNFDPSDPDGDSTTSDALPYDQRSVPFLRIGGGRIDMGAIEVHSDGNAVSADFDANGQTDGHDFLTQQRRFGAMVTATISDGDATGEGDVDRLDLDVWELQFGETVAVSSHQSAISRQRSAQADGELAGAPSTRSSSKGLRASYFELTEGDFAQSENSRQSPPAPDRLLDYADADEDFVSRPTIAPRSPSVELERREDSDMEGVSIVSLDEWFARVGASLPPSAL